MRVAVIGAGAVGVSSAEWLRRDGAEVVLIDPAGPAGETSSGNAGLIAAPVSGPTQYPGIEWEALRSLAFGKSFRLDWARLPQLSPWLWAFWRNSGRERVRALTGALSTIQADAVEQHRTLAAGTPAERYIGDCEWWRLERGDRPTEDDGLRTKRANGFPLRAVSTAELRETDPHLNPAYRCATAMGGYGRISDPAAYVQALASYFEGQGGRILRAAAREIRQTEAGVEVVCDGETVAADRLVIAAGAWTERFARQLGLRSMIIAERGYHVECWAPSRTPPDGLVYLTADSYHCAHGMIGRLRVTSISEPAGVDSKPNKGAQAYLRKGPKLFYPDLEQERVTEWMGRRPATPDSLPLLGAAPGAPRVFFAAGHQHLGLTMGPKAGRLIADLVAGRRPNIDLAPFAVDRFS